MKMSLSLPTPIWRPTPTTSSAAKKCFECEEVVAKRRETVPVVLAALVVQQLVPQQPGKELLNAAVPQARDL